MLDQKQRRAVGADAIQKLHQRAAFRRVHAGRGLIEREELRLGGERARDLEPALVAVRQRAREVVAVSGDAAIVKDLMRAPLDGGLLGFGARAATTASDPPRVFSVPPTITFSCVLWRRGGGSERARDAVRRVAWFFMPLHPARNVVAHVGPVTPG